MYSEWFGGAVCLAPGGQSCPECCLDMSLPGSLSRLQGEVCLIDLHSAEAPGSLVTVAAVGCLNQLYCVQNGILFSIQFTTFVQGLWHYIGNRVQFGM